MEQYQKSLICLLLARFFLVASNSDTVFSSVLQNFPIDIDGVSRVYSTIQGALDACSDGRGDLVLVLPRSLKAGDTDPGDWAENLTVNKSLVTLMGMTSGRTQGRLPQLKKGSGSSPLITVNAPAFRIANFGVNGAGSTGVGIKLMANGSTVDAFGAVIENCHFKNCKGSTATNAATGGAIQLSGSPWQILIRNNKFYKNVGGIVLLDTANSVPQDIHIEGNSFASAASSVDCDIYLAGGSGAGAGLVIRGNDFGLQPNIASGTNKLYMDLTGCDEGILADNYFATATGTFGASGNAGKVPTTVKIIGNYIESGILART